MKKLTFIVLLFTGLMASAQLAQGNSLISAGVGVGLYEGSGAKMKIPPVSLAYEYMVTDNISAGLEAGYYKFGYDFGVNMTSNVDGESSSASIGSSGDYDVFYVLGIGNYHFVNNYNLDVYGGIKLGYANASGESSTTATDSEGNTVNMSANTGPRSGLAFGAQVGGRYMFSDSFGAFAELGYGTSIIKLGVTLKLGY